nr:MAG TPA: baseplate wedge protein [Caudoviricetes sp.]
MQLKTFNEILTEICDCFDSLISPKSIARTNTNVIYLIFKAIAKGYEVINNVCVTLSNKFNPASCSDEDLESVAQLVGTERLLGSGSGLYIKGTNTGAKEITLPAGYYHYALDDNTIFTFEVLSDTLIPRGESATFFSVTDNYGSFPVTEQSSIQVYSDSAIPSGLTFSCTDNSALLGTKDETNTEFRNRILADTLRQDSLAELQLALRNLPYIFDARVYFNNSFTSATYDGVTIPPYNMAIFYSGEARSEIAELVASKGIYPTVQTADSIELNYLNTVFASGKYTVYVIPFKKTQYSVKVTYKADSVYADVESIELAIRANLLSKMNTQIHSDVINEADIYNTIEKMGVAGAKILNVDLFVDGSEVKYVNIPLSRIPELTVVSFSLVA